MSQLSFVEKLLDGAEVEWKKLDDIGEFLRGKRFVKADMKSEGVPCIHYGEMYTHFGVFANEAKSFLDEGVAVKLRVANPGDVIIVAAGETIEDIGNGTAWLGESDIVFHDACFSFKSNLDPRYVAYYLRTNQFKEQIRRSISSGKISSINAKGLGKANIPIPCPDNPEKSLVIQAEIVRILDSFTELTTELTTELNARKKQYSHYRDELLRFEDTQVEWKALGGLCESISAGGDVPKNSVKGQTYATDEFPYPIYANATGEKGLYGYSEKYKIESDAVTISARGAKVGYHTIRKGKFTPIIRLIVLVANKEVVTTKYLNYVLDMTPIGGTEGGIPQLTVPMVKKITVPIPFPEDSEKSLEEQDRIVKILDNFEILTNSISEGLPREIELRQKQYEYYRDLLLSFPNKEQETV